jgi:spore germination protein
MADLKVKEKIAPWQLAIIVGATGIGSEMILASAQLIQQAGRGAWISVLLGGGVYFFSAYLMVLLAEQYPGQTLVQYLPKLWGKLFGAIFIWWLIFVYLFQFIIILKGMGRVITYNIFVRTPEEATALLLLLACVYCAMQEWDVILRIQEIISFTSLPLLLLMWSTSLLIVQHENLLPILPDDIPGMLAGSITSWSFYTGYEVILLIYPLVHRRGASKVKTVGAAFGCMTIFYVFFIAVSIGVLTAKTAGNMSYPPLAAIKGVEIPGTFLERLEVHILLLWIPLAFDSMVIFLAVPAFILAQYSHYSDHRIWVALQVPLICAAFLLLDKMPLIEKASHIATAVGVSFSLIAIPLTLLLSWLRRHSRKNAENERV